MAPLLLLLLITSCIAQNIPLSSVPKDPDVGLDMMEITKSKGYPIEEHSVTTDDGYILGVFRIPYGRNETNNSLNIGKPPVLLQHGLLDSSYTWVCNFPGMSLAFILADAGYDVWMGNNRGTTYSKRHVQYKTNSKEFWNFTYDEMAQFDTPNTIEYILNYTNQSQLAYAGHSEGTIQMFAMPTFRPDLVPKIAFYGGLAPIAYVHHQKSILLDLLAAFDVANIFELIGLKQFLPGDVVHLLAPTLCRETPTICGDVLFLLCGPTQDINNSRIQVYVSETPADTSSKNMVHWSQGVKHKGFKRFDYGSKEENEKHYGPGTNGEPPSYNLSAVTMPLGLYSGTHDYLADEKDVDQLMADLPKGVIKQATVVDGFAHLDFTWGMHANTSVYLKPNLLTQIETYLGPGIIPSD